MKREDAFNENLGRALRRTNPLWKDAIIVEETQTINESAGKHVDVLVAHPKIPIVAVETSYARGDADKDAIARLGNHYNETMEEIKTAIAVDLDKKYRKKTRLAPGDNLRYALHQKAGNHQRRFPAEGFMEGSYKDIARLISSVAVPKEKIEEVGKEVGDAIKAVSNKLDGILLDKHLEKIEKELYQRTALSALNTTGILWLNAFLVQRMLPKGVYNIPPTSSTPSECIDAWKTIHAINWTAIFKPAIRILESVSSLDAGVVSESLELLLKAVEKIEMAKLGLNINIGAELFPMLVEDRKKSAAFYTQPATAEILTALTITPDMVKDWSDPKLFQKFHIADLACGTGTLLRFGYRQVRIYHEQSGGKKVNIEELHKQAMEHGLFGVDVSPIASHLTSTSLAMGSKQPYSRTHIGWVGVGDPDKTGSIEYIGRDSIQELGLLGSEMGTSSGQETGPIYNSVTIKEGGMDVCLLNPPYSRTRRGQSAFDIRGLGDADRMKCQEKWKRLIQGEACNKVAGMGATFLCIAKKKIKPGGRLGFVLPRSMAAHRSWKETRNMIEKEFEDIVAVVVESGKALGKKAMSADTEMEEMLLVATKKPSPSETSSPVRCVLLKEPVTRVGEAAEIARAILKGPKDGPVILGSEIGVSHMFKADNGRPWSSLGVAHDGFNNIMSGLLCGNINNLDGTRAADIKMTTIGELFNVGPTHHLIGHLRGGDQIGEFTFDKVSGKSDTMGIYRALWGVNNKVQLQIITDPTHKGTIYKESGCESMWKTKTRFFMARGMRWTSQKITVAVTPNSVMGGPSWTGISYDGDELVLKAFALWGNSIYGMSIYLAHGGKTHSGRSRVQVQAIRDMPCPNFEKFSHSVLVQAGRDFDRLGTKTLKIANQAKSDSVRAEINDAVSRMFNLKKYDTKSLTKIWCDEPAVKKPPKT